MAPTAPLVAATAAVTSPSPASDAPLAIRSYEPKDYTAVCDLFAEGMLVYRPSEQDDPFLYHGFTEYVDKCIEDDLLNIESVYMGSGGHFWVVPAVDKETGREEIAAMVALEGKGDGIGELRRLSVNAKYRRHGLGWRLVKHVEQWASAHGFTHIQLNTDIAMTPALKLYDRLGYTRAHHETIREDPPYYLVWFRKALA